MFLVLGFNRFVRKYIGLKVILKQLIYTEMGLLLKRKIKTQKCDHSLNLEASIGISFMLYPRRV